jgi:hypothetical protein
VLVDGMMEGRNEVEAVSIGYMKHTQFTIHIIAPKREFFLNIQRLSPFGCSPLEICSEQPPTIYEYCLERYRTGY